MATGVGGSAQSTEVLNPLKSTSLQSVFHDAPNVAMLALVGVTGVVTPRGSSVVCSEPAVELASRV
jgi:hypothetical protein